MFQIIINVITGSPEYFKIKSDFIPKNTNYKVIKGMLLFDLLKETGT